jgi:biopolymer transport protein ExbB/TolQ
VDTSIVQGLFSFLTNNIYTIIYLFAVVEIYLVIAVFYMMKGHERSMQDATDNLLKGFADAPDKDSSQHTHEKIQNALQYITDKVAQNSDFKKDFCKNAGKVNERPVFGRHYKIEIYASVMSTMVQIFPLLGILGTILAIAQSSFQNGGQIDVASLSNAFVLAMDTTIMGIAFSIVFMVIESAFQPKIERVISESSEFRKILSSISLS